MPEQSGEILKPDAIITKDKNGNPLVSLVRSGKVLPANPNSGVSQTVDEQGRLSVRVQTGRIIRGKTQQSGASQAELQADFKPFLPQKITKK